MADPASGGAALTAAEPDQARALEAGRKLFAQQCRFSAAAVDEASLPPARLPEIAFAGRSNVGKSSLINALVGQKALARASRTPGRTQQINFFDLGGRLMLVDLPGYGYARAPKSQVAAWTRLIEAYLRGRSMLRQAVLLVDARHGFKDSDRDAMKVLDASAVGYRVVLAKADAVGDKALESMRAQVADEAARHAAAYPAIMAASARTGQGIAELRTALAGLADMAA